MSFEEKYIKYKNKYLELQNLYGGGNKMEDSDFIKSNIKMDADEFTEKCKVYSLDLPFNEWNLYQLDEEKSKKVIEKYGNFKIIEKVFDIGSTDKPVLVAMAGYSIKSFCGSSNIILQYLKKSNKLQEKYKAIYILCYDEDIFKVIQKKACSTTNKKIEEKKGEDNTTINYREYVYEDETNMFNELGSIIDKVIKSLGHTKVHLLGKSAGGGTCIGIVNTNNPIYEKLYLAVPAHPTYCHSLIDKIQNRLENFKVIIGWNQNDDMLLAQIPSNENMKLWEKIFKDIQKKYAGFKYEQHMFEPGNEPGNGHEINPNLLEIIAKDI